MSCGTQSYKVYSEVEVQPLMVIRAKDMDLSDQNIRLKIYDFKNNLLKELTELNGIEVVDNEIRCDLQMGDSQTGSYPTILFLNATKVKFNIVVQ